MCVPSGVTDVEQRAVIEAARDVGAKDIYIIEEPVAAALGAGFDISRPHGTMAVSYTHLDVYKRQLKTVTEKTERCKYEYSLCTLLLKVICNVNYRFTR